MLIQEEGLVVRPECPLVGSAKRGLSGAKRLFAKKGEAACTRTSSGRVRRTHRSCGGRSHGEDAASRALVVAPLHHAQRRSGIAHHESSAGIDAGSGAANYGRAGVSRPVDEDQARGHDQRHDDRAAKPQDLAPPRLLGFGLASARPWSRRSLSAFLAGSAPAG